MLFKEIKTVLLATGDISIPSCEWLIENSNLIGLVTQPDKPVGRKQILSAPKVKEVAESKGVPVFQPENINTSDSLEHITKWDPDVIIVFAYGQILNPPILMIPKTACINIHGSLLPKYRGASCIQGAIASGDSKSGITIIHMNEKLDAGDIVLTRSIPLNSEITGGQLLDVLSAEAVPALQATLEKFASGQLEGSPQDHSLSSYVKKLTRRQGILDWSLSAEQLERTIRAYDPWPGTTTAFQSNQNSLKRIKVFPPTIVHSRKIEPGKILIEDNQFFVGCGKNSLEITRAQIEGGKVMDTTRLLQGHTFSKVSCFQEMK